MNEKDPYAPLRDELPRPELRPRVEAGLRRGGLIGSPLAWWRTPFMRLAAGLLLFLGGTMVGRARDAAQPPAPEFALLLYEPAGFDTTSSHAQLAEEYGAWAAGLGARFVGGEALGEARLVAPGGATPAALGGEQPTGYFLVRAASWDEALALAAQCPHVRHGGIVAVRDIST